MVSDQFFIGLAIGWVILRLALWRRSNRNAGLRLSKGETELANGHVVKQPLIYVAVGLVICIEVLKGDRAGNPVLTYGGLAVWCLGLALLLRDLQASPSRWTERLFRSDSGTGKPQIGDDFSQKPWIPWWPLRLELVGLALFCGAPLGALAAWVFCVAHTRAIKNAIFED
jgi:isoprenylcysteine carboxyl methyltransferase (ICMT) family protein YpbQ